MKTLLKIVGGIVVLVALVAACGYSYMMFAYPNVPPAPDITINQAPNRVARGRYLNNHVVLCTTCHTERDWTKYSGPIKEERLGAGGEKFDLGGGSVLYAKNITPAAIGSWTDGELLRSVTQGVSKDGTPLFPLMPYPHYGALSEEDVHDVLAYIRGLAAVEGTPPDRTLAFPLNLIVRTIPAANTYVARPPVAVSAEYGKYLTRAALCTECHTPKDSRGQPLAGMEFAGGMEFRETGHLVRSSNITPDADTGIGGWTEQQFVDKFKGFEKPTGVVLAEHERSQNTVMPVTAYAGMARIDLAAIYAYLLTVKPVVNRVERFPEAR
jgi:mono/diheme cytochrome c family protein